MDERLSRLLRNRWTHVGAAGLGVVVLTAAGLMMMGADRTAAVAADGQRMAISIVAPKEPEVQPGSVMEVGTLTDGFDKTALRDRPNPDADSVAYDPAYQNAYVEQDWTPPPPVERDWGPPPEALPPPPPPPNPYAGDPRQFGFDAPRPDWQAEREARRAAREAREEAARARIQSRVYSSQGPAPDGDREAFFQ